MMKAFFSKWWGKFKSSPMYVKAGLVAVLFFGLYMLFVKKSGTYDNAKTAVVSDTSTNQPTDNTYTPPTTTNGSMRTDDSKALYEAQLAMMQQENDQLSKQLNNASNIKTTPSLTDYLNPVIAQTAGNWLTNLINPNRQTTNSNNGSSKITTANTSSPITTTNNTSNIFGSKNYTGFGSDIFGAKNYGIGSTTVSPTVTFGSDNYTGFGSDTYSKFNYGW
jgi:hypothetical protein